MNSITGEGASEFAAGREVTGSAACSLYEALQRVPDGRRKRGRRYDAAFVFVNQKSRQ
jgi:hypothetical protein